MTRRHLLLPVLLCSAVAPLVLLALVSLGGGWFFPALWPPMLTAESWAQAFGQRGRLGTALGASLLLAIGTGLVSVVLGWIVGRALAVRRGWRRHLGAAAAFLPVAAPPIALATGLQVTMLALGLGGTFLGVLASHVIPATGYTTLFFLGVFTTFDLRIEDEARTLGASSRAVLWRVTVPMLRRQVAEGFLLAALVSWAQVALTLVIGGGVVRTLPLEVFAYVQAGQDRFAATGALLLVMPPLLALTLLPVALHRADMVPP